MTTEELIVQGKQFVGEMRFNEAEQSFREAAKQESVGAEPLAWLAWLSFMRLENREGNEFLERALESDPSHPRALALKGMSALEADDFAAAASLLEQARTADPDFQMVYGGLAKAYRKSGRMEEAEQAAREAIRREPKDYISRCELSYILGRTGRMNEAVEELTECIRINPFFGKPYLILGELSLVAKKIDDAIAVYKQALRVNPKAFPIRQKLCDVLASQSDYRAAYVEAVELITRRNLAADYVRLGTYAVAIDQLEKARKAFAKAQELSPEKWWVFSPEEIYEASGMGKPAEDLYEKVETFLREEQQQGGRSR